MAKLQEYELMELYKDLIDQVEPVVKIFEMEYEASRVLQEVDPIAFRVGFYDWIDGEENCEDCGNNPLECTCEAI